MPSAIMPTPASWLARLHAGEDAGATLRGPGGSLLREHDVPVHALVEQRGVRSHGVFGIGLKIDVLSPHAVLKVMDLRDSLGNPAPANTVCVSDVLLAVDGKSVENVRHRPPHTEPAAAALPLSCLAVLLSMPSTPHQYPCAQRRPGVGSRVLQFFPRALARVGHGGRDGMGRQRRPTIATLRGPPRELRLPDSCRGTRPSWRAPFSARKTVASAWPCARLRQNYMNMNGRFRGNEKRSQRNLSKKKLFPSGS